MLMNNFRSPMHLPTFPSRSKLAESVAMTQSNFRPRRGFCIKWSGSRNANLSGTASSFQQVISLPSFCNASVSPSWEPMQSPSGRTCPTTQIVRQSRIPSRMRLTILGRGFILRESLFDLFDNFQHLVAMDNRIINFKPQLGSVFENDRLRDLPLDAPSVFHQQAKSLLLLVGAAQDAHKNRGGMQIT